MSSTDRKLTALKVASLNAPGFHGDGGNLYLQVSPTGTKSWVLRYQIAGRQRWMGLGPLELVSLSDARKRALAARLKLLEGIDPIEEKRAARRAAGDAVTFKEAAERYIAAHEKSWKNPVHRAQWTSTLTAYAYPTLAKTPVDAITVGHVIKVLEPIWSTKSETASRVRGRIELVLDWASARGYRQGDNPARWRGHLDKLLPPKSRVAKVKHHAALPYGDLPDFMVALEGQEGVGARALAFTILTAARTGETIGATWDEIDLDAKCWTVPAERMKAEKEHRVPLSKQALGILKALPREGEYVFPGGKAKRPLSNVAMLAVLRRMGRGNITTHGFRSTFRDWAAERTSYAAEVAEMALAHTVADKVEAAYRRGDMFEKRRRFMQDWATFATSSPTTATVTPLRAS